MVKLVFRICCLFIAACCGCAADGTSSSSPQQAHPRLQPSQTTAARVQLVRIADVPNNGLQLPVVSPNAKWVAYLDYHSDKPIELEALFTGRGSHSMSLKLASLAGARSSRTIYDSGAVWPVWSPDSKQLVFIAYDQMGPCRLGIYDLSTSGLRLVNIAATHAIMPAVSPNNRHVAFVTPGDEAQSFRLHVVDLNTAGLIATCPTELTAGKQLWPQWTNQGQIVFVHIHDKKAWLAQWLPGKSFPRRLTQVRIAPSRTGIFQALAGLPHPLSPDDSRFAYYDTAADRIVLLTLRNQTEQSLPIGVRSGCWLDPQRFAAADDQDLRLFSAPDAAPTPLIHGQWLPRHGQKDELILCRPGPRPGLFSLVRMSVLTSQ